MVFCCTMINSTQDEKVHIRIQRRIRKVFTHRGRKNNNSKDIHSIACSFPSTYEHIGRRSQIKGEVLDVSSIIILDTINERSSGGRLWLGLTHCWFGLHNVLATCSILLPGNRNRSTKELQWSPKKKTSLCVWKCSVMSNILPAEMWPGPD